MDSNVSSQSFDCSSISSVKNKKRLLLSSFAFSGSYLSDKHLGLGLLKTDLFEGRFILGKNSTGEILIFDRWTSQKDTRNTSNEISLISPISRYKHFKSNARSITEIFWYPLDQGIFVTLNGPDGICTLWDTSSFKVRPLLCFLFNV